MIGKHSASFHLFQIVAILALLFLLLPSFVVLPISLTDTSYLALPQNGLSGEHWAEVFADPRWMEGLGQSLFIAAVATLAATIAGTLCAVGCWRSSSTLGEIIRVLALLPLIVPVIVYALGLYRVYAQLGLLDTFTGVILAHTVMGLPYVVITVGAALTNLDPKLELAARSLGASQGQILWRVLLPNLRPGMLAGAVFAFITSWDELVVVLFIASRRVHTLPREIWSGLRESLDPSIAVVAMILIGVTFLALLPTLISRGSEKRS